MDAQIKDETLCDIIAESYHNTAATQYVRKLLDRLDRARMKMESEIANLRKENAKLRDALEELVANIEMRSSTFGLNVMVDTKTYLDAKTALAAPPLNCDVGDAADPKRP